MVYMHNINSNARVFRCRSLGDCLSPQTHCYTLEVSFFSYNLQQGATDMQVPYTEEACILLSLRITE